MWKPLGVGSGSGSRKSDPDRHQNCQKGFFVQGEKKELQENVVDLGLAGQVGVPFLIKVGTLNGRPGKILYLVQVYLAVKFGFYLE
jgi:hypothetical protein